MIIYEVNLEIQSEILAEYLVWLKKHIAEILQIEGFVKATIYKVERNDLENSYAFSVQYYLASREFLESYFANHSQRLRQEGIDKFGDKFKASRRILIEEF